MNLAELSSGHPDPRARRDPRFQRNNTLNTQMLPPAAVRYGTIYGDGAVLHQLPGVQFTDARATPDPNPAALTPQQSQAGDFLAQFTTQLPMSQSQVAKGDHQAAMRRGMFTSLSGSRAQKGGYPPRLA
jgi:hypothetical protein